MQAVIERDEGCVFRRFAPYLDVLCFGALTAHELTKRSHGADPTNPDECVCLCWGHNGWVEDNPRLAAEV